MKRIRGTWKAVAIIAALSILPGSAVTAAEQTPPAAQPKAKGDFVRIRVSPKAVVYVQSSQGEMRMATTGAGLRTAKPIKAKRRSSDYTQFPEVTLPVPAEALPAGFTKVTAELDFDRISLLGPVGRGVQTTYVFGTLGLCQKDKAGATWIYAMRYNAQPGRSLVEAPEIQVAQLSPLRLEVIAKVSRKRLGAGVHVWSGKTEVDDILKNGKPAEVQMRILDDRGVAVVAAKGPLAKFGFG
jgi:hypothetical protein